MQRNMHVARRCALYLTELSEGCNLTFGVGAIGAGAHAASTAESSMLSAELRLRSARA